MIPLGWVNIPVFDYKGYLRSGKCTLYLWDITNDKILSEEEHLNPIGMFLLCLIVCMYVTVSEL